MIYYNDGNTKCRDSIETDIKVIAQDMRQSDKDEIYASHHKEPLDALREGFNESILCFTVEHNNKPCIMFGVVPFNFLDNRGRIWMLATSEFRNCHRKFLKYGKIFLNYMLEHYSELSNFIDVRNELSIRWLSWLGAEMGEAVPYGAEKLLFRPFLFRKEKNVNS